MMEVKDTFTASLALRNCRSRRWWSRDDLLCDSRDSLVKNTRMGIHTGNKVVWKTYRVS